MNNRSYLTLSLGLLAALAIAAPAPAQSAPPQQPAPQQNAASATDPAAKPKDASSDSAPKKVYTNGDLSGRGGGGVSVVGNSKSTAKTGQAATNQPKNEQYWRNRAQQLRNQMAEVDRQIAQFESANQNQHTASTSSNGTNPPPPPPSAYTVEAHVRGSANANNPLERLKRRKAQIQQEMDQLEEEARRANVPAGWLR